MSEICLTSSNSLIWKSTGSGLGTFPAFSSFLILSLSGGSNRRSPVVFFSAAARLSVDSLILTSSSLCALFCYSNLECRLVSKSFYSWFNCTVLASKLLGGSKSVQGFAKRWALGCVNASYWTLAPSGRGVRTHAT